LRDITHGVEAPDLAATQCEGFRFLGGYGKHALHMAKDEWPNKAGAGGVVRTADFIAAL
jgi:hypothetical protein